MIPDDDKLLETIKLRYQKADSKTEDWRRESRLLYDMVAGDQWDPVDKQRMQETLRPAVTFNIAGKFVDAVSGIQITNRQEIKYLPREPGDSGVNELLTGAADWARDECDAEDEESEAFLDMIICGLGCMEMSISFDEDPMGFVNVERRDPLEMRVDPTSRRRNHRDARWCMRVKGMNHEDFIERWGEELFDEVIGSMGMDHEEYIGGDIHHATEAHLYENDAMGVEVDENVVTVVHYEWWKRSDAFIVQTQFGEKTFTPEQWRKMRTVLEQNGIDFKAQKKRRRRFYRAFAAGDTILEADESPYQEGFTFQFLTGKRERNTNTWYGIARALQDPQMWVNKLFSNILHAVTSNANGGLVAEEGVFTDPQKAEDDWARPDSIVFVEDGAIANGRIMPKPAAPYPAGMDKLMQFAMSSAPEVSGLNLEIIGLANRVQPGIVEAQRKEAAISVISWAFDSMRRYYKDHGRQLAYYIREYLADGRLARITTEQGQQYIPLVKDNLTMEFDVIVDEAPTSTNVKERVWAVVSDMLKPMLEMGIPIPPEVLDYSPLPNDLAQKWKEMMQPDPEQQQQQQMQLDLERRDKEAEIKKDESHAVLNFAKAAETSAKAGKTASGG
jgi:hypothetical protein